MKRWDEALALRVKKCFLDTSPEATVPKSKNTNQSMLNCFGLFFSE